MSARMDSADQDDQDSYFKSKIQVSQWTGAHLREKDLGDTTAPMFLFRAIIQTKKWVFQSFSILPGDKITKQGRGISGQQQCLQNSWLTLQPRLHQGQGKRSTKWDGGATECPLAFRCCVQAGHQLLPCAGNVTCYPSQGNPGVIPPFILILRGLGGPSDGSWGEEMRAGRTILIPLQKIW